MGIVEKCAFGEVIEQSISQLIMQSMIDGADLKSEPFRMSGKAGLKWRRLISAFVILAFAGLLLLCVNQWPSDPIYRGKKLSIWLETYAPSSPAGAGSPAWRETDEAVRNIGTNAIPFLLHLLREKDSDLKLKMLALTKRQRIIKIRFVPAATRNREASMAFLALGDAAKNAVPELIKIYNGKDSSSESKCAIEDVFSWLGPTAKPALPLLLQAATNSDSKVRANALWALGEIKAEPELCVPTLLEALKDSNEWAQTSAIHALGKFGTNAQAAVPSLVELANSTPRFRGSVVTGLQLPSEARRALKNIDPDSVSHSEPLPNLTLPIADPLNPPR